MDENKIGEIEVQLGEIFARRLVGVAGLLENDRVFSCLRHHPTECLSGLRKPAQDGVGDTR